MPDDLLPPDLPPTPADPPSAPAPRARRTQLIECEFCGCGLTPEGEVLRRGDVARRYLDLDAELKEAQFQLKETADALAAVREELAALKAPPVPVKTRSIFS